MRRRGPPTSPAKGNMFEDAYASINKMEAAVCYHTVTRLSRMQLMEVLYPAEIRRVCKEAHVVCALAGGTTLYSTVVVQCTFFRFEIDVNGLMAVPTVPPRWDDAHPYAKEVFQALQELRKVVEDHEILREVIRWLHADKVTLNAARYYFPALGQLLPTGHPFHMADGTKFREPDSGVPGAKVRKCIELIAAGMFAMQGYEPKATHVGVSMTHSDGYGRSQTFPLGPPLE